MMIHVISSLAIFGFVVPLTSQYGAYASGGVENEAVARQLTAVFGIAKVPETGALHHSMRRHRSPPEYLTDLYRTVAYLDGISRRSSPYDADVVRGIPDKGRQKTRLQYLQVQYAQSA